MLILDDNHDSAVYVSLSLNVIIRNSYYNYNRILFLTIMRKRIDKLKSLIQCLLLEF